MNRYFLEPGAWTETNLTLTGEEAHHATRVMRVQQGEQIEVFDGAGKSATCTVTQVSRQELDCRIDHSASQPPSLHPITLCQAIPKGGNMELIVQKAVELGVNAIQPLITAHTVARPEALDKKQGKWQRIALEACKQCGQNYLPRILEPLQFNHWINDNNLPDLRLVAALSPNARNIKDILSEHPATGSLALLIGPEGDFSPEEYNQAFSKEFHPVSFGNIILRVETASLYGLSVLHHELHRP